MSEIIELIDIFTGINHHTLYTIDELNYRSIAYVENRQYQTIIGQKSKVLRLEELNDEEYHAANHYLLNDHRIMIEHGGQNSPEYREPRVLRHLASVYKHNLRVNQYSRIQAVPDLGYLNLLAQNRTYSKNVHELYKAIAVCFLAEHNIRKQNAELAIAASGRGAIRLSTFQKFSPGRVRMLVRSSLVVLRTFRNAVTVIFPRIPELLAKYSISSLTLEILKDAQSNKPIAEICNAFIDRVTPLPYCDIVGAGVLMELAERQHVDLFSDLVTRLMDMPPRNEPIKKGTQTLMYLEDAGHINMNFESDGEEGGLISDFLPYTILSQLARYPLKLVDNKANYEYAFHLTLLHTVGATPNFIRRTDARSINNVASHKSYDWNGIGQFTCGDEGIIEPIVQSMVQCYVEIPDAMDRLIEQAFRDNNFILLWRLQLAIRTLINVVDEANARRANEFMNRFLIYFDTFMSDFLSQQIEDPIVSAEVKQMLLGMDFTNARSNEGPKADL